MSDASISPGQLALPPWLPADQGLLAANADPWLTQNSSTLTAGSVYLAKLPVRSPTQISNVWFGLAVTGAGASSGSFAGLYSPAGLLIATSADIGAAITGPISGLEFPLLGAPFEVNGGPESQWPWSAIVVNLATTQPAMIRGQGSSAYPNLNLTPANSRFAIAAAGQTSLPASFTPSALATTGGANLWTGAS